MKKTTEILPVIVCGWMLLYCVDVNAGIYQWVDEDGKVHYSDRPGAEEDAEEITVEPPKEDDRPAPGEGDRERTRQRLLEQYEKERLEKQAAAAKRKAEQVQRKRNCTIAKYRLSSFERGALYEIGPDGERVYLSDAERERALAEARADVKRWCK